MGIIRVILFILFTIMSALISTAHAAWNGPQAVINLGWGQGAGQVGLESTDTADIFPRSVLISTDNKIAVADIVNNRVIILNSDGSLQRVFSPLGIPAGARIAKIQWGFLSGRRLLIKLRDKYQIYDYNGNLQNQFSGMATYIGDIFTLSDDSIVVYKTDTRTYYHYSSTGQLIKTSMEKPIELGRVKEQSLNDDSFKFTISYPERIYSIVVPDQRPEQIVRDINGNLNVSQRLVDVLKPGTLEEETIQHHRVIRFSYCGKEISRLDLPEDEYEVIGRDIVVGVRERVLAEYGQPVIAPNGDVYVWKRTPDTYSILKWTWVDDPNTPPCPDEKAAGESKREK